MGIHSSILVGNSMDRGTWQAKVHGVARVRHDLATKHTCTQEMQISQGILFHLATLLCMVASILPRYMTFLRGIVAANSSQHLNDPGCPGERQPRAHGSAWDTLGRTLLVPTRVTVVSAPRGAWRAHSHLSPSSEHPVDSWI